MMIPVLAFITNILLTMRGRWDCFIESIPLRFILIGAFLYFLASAQGTFQAFQETNMYLHFGQWAVGHAHIALLGGFGFLVMGAIYFLIPRITGKEIYSKRLMSYHFWFTMLGFILFFSIMTMFFITVILPYLLMDYPPSDISHPYSDEQGRRREIYKSNGCLYCHSQFVRPQDWGLGRTSLPGDYFYDRPHLFGTERTGPDLAQIGGQRPPLWEIMHHRNPRSVSPGSIMPPDISWKNSFFPALPALPWSLRHWPGTLCAAC